MHSSAITTLPRPIRQANVRRLLARIRQQIEARLDSRCALDALTRATDGELYLCGGAVRRALLGARCCGDLDIMVPNCDPRAQTALDSMGVPFRLNSYHHRRYRWNGLEIDLFEPKDFFDGHETVTDALRYFDLCINAIAIHLGTSRVIDPFELLQEPVIRCTGLNWPGWATKTPLQVVILAIRLVRIMYEAPSLRISRSDVDRLRATILPQVRASDWSDVRHRFPQGKERFLELFRDEVLRRVDF
jgi:hypothetical protein